MGSIVATLGGGSGIDMSKLAADLSTAQFQARKARLAARSTLLDRQISSASTIRNALSTLASSIGDRVRSGDLAVTASVANPAVASAAIASGAASGGAYSLEVTALASSQTLASGAFASASDPVGQGTLTIRFGTIAGSTFAEDAAHAALSIDVAPGATLADVARSINAAKGGISAYVATTAEGTKLVLKGGEGAASAFVIEAAESAPGNGLSALAWNPASSDPARRTGTASDAAFKLDGLAMTSPTNRTGQVAPGLTLALTGTNPGAPTTISFSASGAAVPGMMSDLVSALNEVVTELRTATAIGSGELASDSGARKLRSSLSQLTNLVIMPSTAQGRPRTLADLGLKIARDGSFAFDADRLQKSLTSDPAAVAAMLTTGLDGIYATFDKLGRDTAKASDPGSLAASIARYEKLAASTRTETGTLDDKQEALRVQLVQRFAKADTSVAASQSTLTFLKAQIDAWNAGRN